jgi:hypothetical protein
LRWHGGAVGLPCDGDPPGDRSVRARHATPDEEICDVTTLLFVVAAAIAGLMLLETLIRRTEVGAVLVLGLVLLLETGVWNLDVAAGSMRIGPNDVLFALLLTAAIARLLRAERLSTPQRLLVVLGILVVASIIQGAGEFGLPATVNEARKFLVFTGSALYFSTMDARPELMHKIGRLWLIVAVGLCLLTLVRWTLDVPALTDGAYESGASLRVIPAAGALFIAQGAIIAFPMIADRSRPLFLRFLAPGLLAFVILLQHRTVWILTAASVLYLLFRERAMASRILLALVLALAVFATLVFTVFADRDDAVTDQLERSAQSTGTFEWRVDGWQALITDSGPEGLFEVLTGQPFGGGWARTMENGAIVDVSPHSFYVEPYLRVGLVGLAAMLLAYADALRRTAAAGRRSTTTGQPGGSPTLLGPNPLHTVIAVQLLFFVTYTPDASQALLLGLGLAFAAPLARQLSQRDTSIEVPA